jgi:hypothetical protein
MVVETKRGRVVVEIKCPYTFRDTTLEIIKDSIRSRPRKTCVDNTALKYDGILFKMNKTHAHYRQVQSQIYVTGAVRGLYVVSVGNWECVIVEVERDEAMIAELETKELNMIAEKMSGFDRRYRLESVRLKTTEPEIAFLGMHKSKNVYICSVCDQKPTEPLKHTSCFMHKKNVPLTNWHRNDMSVLRRRENTGCDEAEEGFYLNNGLKHSFCCGTRTYQYTPGKHLDDCRFQFSRKYGA